MEREEAFENGRKAGLEQGREEERINTEREKERADQAISRVNDMEAEIQRLREEIEKYKNQS